MKKSKKPAKAPAEGSPKELTPRQRLFVASYVKCLNATQAAIEAGYSKHTARQIGSELLGKPEIQDAVAAAVGKRLEKAEVSADQVLEELHRIAFADSTEYPAARKVPKSKRLRLGMYDKTRALELLGKYLKLFVERAEFKWIKELEGMTDEELLDFISKNSAVLKKAKGDTT